MTAVDPDVGSNGKVTYSLSGMDANKFQVNPDTGVVTAAQRLSGSVSSYRFQVTASDQVSICFKEITKQNMKLF